MSPALRDLSDHTMFDRNSVEKILELTLVQGVKIGGVYRHWKGGEYLVTDVVWIVVNGPGRRSRYYGKATRVSILDQASVTKG